MSNTSSVSLTHLDFTSYKNSLKSYLKAQTEFKDYDFEGSSMNVLLDLLSYNTYNNAFYLNQVSNEMFLDSARLRESIVSHAKELNYTPRSFSSAKATIDLQIVSTDTSKRSLVLPKGTQFTSRVAQDNFTFSTDQNIVLTSSNSTFLGENIDIYEGVYISETYPIDYSKPLTFKLSNKTVDISSITVLVLEDNGSTSTTYTKATSLFGLDSTSEVFFVQPSLNGSYEILFGDGVIGKKPKNNSVAIIDYRFCNGELPNGAKKFTASGRIDGEANITITTVNSAQNGAVAESLDSIKFNAPRAFTTQERAVTAEDYENLLKINFPEINAVSAYGGEDATPPQYGKVFIAVDLKDIDSLPLIKKQQYGVFLRNRSSLTIEPIFIAPDYTYLGVTTTVKYNVNTTVKNPEDLRTQVLSAILSYSADHLNNFGRTVRYSRLVNHIDSADGSILSNETKLNLIKYLDLTSVTNLSLLFKLPLYDDIPLKADTYPASDLKCITSERFTYEGDDNCYLEDDGDGILYVVSSLGLNRKKIVAVGEVDYAGGHLHFKSLPITTSTGKLKVYALPKNKDIESSKNVILNILEDDIIATIDQVRE